MSTSETTAANFDPQAATAAGNTTPAGMASALLACPGRIVITAHVRPDGDAFGTALALCLALQAAGRSAVCTGLEPIGDEFAFLEGREAVIPAADYVPADGDVMAVVDCGDVSRIPGPLREQDRTRTHIGFCIDHHQGYSGFALVSLIDPSASSSAELVQAVIEAGKLPMSRGVAEALWAGVVTDTGRFSYPAATPLTFRRAAVLIEHGARFAMINERVFNTVPLCRLRLKSRLLDSLVVSGSGRVAMGSLSPDDFAAVACDVSDSENFVDVVRSIQGVRIAVFVRQVTTDAAVNISLRTTEPYDASAICAEWGGGGHARASGATLPGPLGERCTDVFARLQAIEQEQDDA